jgi:hemolysin activation/secretion protein
LASAVVTACFCLAAAAQQRPDAGAILEQQEQRERVPQPPSAAPVVEPKAPAPPEPGPAPAVRFTLKEIRFSGNTAIPDDVLRALLQDFIGKTLDFNMLKEAAARVQRYYRDRGFFLAVAYLPAQEIRAGAVEIAVLEGRLGRVDLLVAPQARLRESYVRGGLDANLQPGQLITQAAIERPLLLLRDLPGITVSSTIGPSSTQTGAADLRVDVQESERRFEAFVDFDNFGNRFTGEYRAGLNLNGNNLTGYGDLLSVRGLVSERGDLRFGRIAYLVPAGYYGTRLGASYTRFEYRLGENFAALQAHGEGDVATVYALHPLIRSRNANLFVQLALEQAKFADRVDAPPTLAENRKVTARRFGPVGDVRDALLGGGVNTYSLAYTDGTLSGADTASGLANGNFARWNADLRRQQRLTNDSYLLLLFSGQAASRNLSASEKFLLGGPTGVRAYPTGEAPGDSGYLVSAEWRYTLARDTLPGSDLAISVFYDRGRVKTNEDPFPGTAGNIRELAGYGFGVSVGRERNFLLRASIAWPADSEAPVSDPAKREPRVWFQAIKWL